MAPILGRFILVLLLVLPSTILFAGNDGSPSVMVYVQDVDDVEDLVEGEEEDTDATVETEPEDMVDAGSETVPMEGEKEDEEAEEAPMKPSPDADTYILFSNKPTGTDFAAGQLVKVLVGFTNKAEQDFTVDNMEASLRYPQDYSFYIQNFTAVRYNKQVEPGKQATFGYAFTPSETFNARPFGLVINLNYRDTEGNMFQDAVYNETIQVIEPDEGLDGETFFLYVFLAAVAVLLLVGAQQLLASFGKKRLSSKPFKPQVEMGTQNKTDVDYDWLPKETLSEMNKSPRRSPKQSPKMSPKKRRAKRATGSADD